MLRALSVENYALIDRLEMTLGPGLNILTGETGAGKSILLGALGLLLGTRGETGVQKDPSRGCVVEGVFRLDGYGLEEFFADNDLEYSPEIAVRRVVSASGRSRAYVGDLPVGLATLRGLGEKLIDIHSQHENLLLKDDRFRISILDGAAGQTTLVKRYGELYAEWKRLSRQLDDARHSAADALRDEEYLRHQAGELAALRLARGEGEALEAERRELSHSDDNREVLAMCAVELGGADGGASGGASEGSTGGGGFGPDGPGIVARLRAMRQAIDRIGEGYPRAEEFSQRLSSVHLELQDMERELVSEYERIEGNPERLDLVAARLDAIYALQQKHRVRTVEELIELQVGLEARLDAIERGGEAVARLEAGVATCEAEVRELAERISEGRRVAAPEVSRSVEGMLHSLGMPQARLVVEVTPGDELRPGGADRVRFLFTANGTVALREIEKIASGGEISRVMLALKTLSARSAGQPTVVFDEIDAGVSGRLADSMGEMIAELGRHCQVLNITHLPQIAAKGGEHFLVYKEDGSTRIRALSAEERVGEIAAMLSGSTVTDAAIRQARELLGSE